MICPKQIRQIQLLKINLNTFLKALNYNYIICFYIENITFII